MTDFGLIFLIVPGFIICFGALWSLIVYLSAVLGGWAGLARQFPATEPAYGKTFRWRSAKFGMFSSYRNCLTVTLSLAGIHMQPMIAFRIGHKPMQIPWGAIAGARRRDLLFVPTVRLDITNANSSELTQITFYGRALIEAMEAHVRIN